MSHITEAQIAFLRANSSSKFYDSLLAQFERKGFLSEKQIACIEKGMAPKPAAAPVADRTFSMSAGEHIEIKRWLAHKLQEQLGLTVFFRNLEVIAIENETPKAFRCSVKFVSTVASSGRQLDNDISRACGIGPVCADHLGFPRPTMSTARETLAMIDALCNSIGVVGPIWIPKSQIKAVANEEATKSFQDELEVV